MCSQSAMRHEVSCLRQGEYKPGGRRPLCLHSLTVQSRTSLNCLIVASSSNWDAKRWHRLVAKALPSRAVLIDLDKFKEVNDTRGHAAGDALLVCVANGLRGRLRSSDIAGRLGGDEFVLLLPGMDATSAKAYIEDLQHRLLNAMNEHQWPVTFSIGIASYALGPADLDDLVAKADALMYEVKYGSKNRALQKDFPTA